MERPPFPAYDGDEPYIFVCYGHGDAGVVYAELSWLRDQGFNIWYDEGISPGTIWRDELAQAIEGAATFLFFVSPRAVESANCTREVHFALDQELPIVAVYLQPAELPAGLRLAILHRQAIHQYELSRTEYERKIRRALTRVEQKPQAATSRAVVAAPRRSRVFVAVEAARNAKGGLARELVTTITQYVSWHGGAFRASIGAVRQIAAHRDPDYRVELTTATSGRDVRVSWHVERLATGEVVWASRFEEAVSEATAKRERIAEMIAEGVLQHITDYELRRIGNVDTDELTYSQLVLSAEQLNYLDRPQLATRERRIARAIELEPNTGLGHALLAELLSWKIANGVADDVRADTQRLHDAAQTALRLDPNDPQVLLSVGLTHCRTLEYTKGLALIRRSLALAPTVKAKDELARSLCFAGQPEEAIGLFRAILDTMPAGHTFPFGRLALALAQAGRIDEGVTYSTLATVHFPSDYYGWIVHANLLAQADRDDEGQLALAEAERLVKGLQMDMVIARTEALYGRDARQRAFLTDGLRRLLAARA